MSPAYIDVTHGDAARRDLDHASRRETSEAVGRRAQRQRELQRHADSIPAYAARGLLSVAPNGRISQTFSCACDKNHNPFEGVTGPVVWEAIEPDELAQTLAERVDRARRPANPKTPPVPAETPHRSRGGRFNPTTSTTNGKRQKR